MWVQKIQPTPKHFEPPNLPASREKKNAAYLPQTTRKKSLPSRLPKIPLPMGRPLANHSLRYDVRRVWLQIELFAGDRCRATELFAALPQTTTKNACSAPSWRDHRSGVGVVVSVGGFALLGSAGRTAGTGIAKVSSITHNIRGNSHSVRHICSRNR